MGTNINMFQKNTRHIAWKNLKTSISSVNFEKYTFEKIAFTIFEGYKDEKSSYLSAAYTNLAEIGYETSEIYA